MRWRKSGRSEVEGNCVELAHRQILNGETPDPTNVPTGCRFHRRCPSAQPQCREADPALHQPNAATADHRPPASSLTRRCGASRDGALHAAILVGTSRAAAGQHQVSQVKLEAVAVAPPAG
ncbi:MAG: DUF397 domain-containing protein [Actinomycetota bacterium]|nr:DUF397 domain-containing protein [Actinomycetota bacterium]